MDKPFLHRIPLLGSVLEAREASRWQEIAERLFETRMKVHGHLQHRDRDFLPGMPLIPYPLTP
jgi:hypothetical protein